MFASQITTSVEDRSLAAAQADRRRADHSAGGVSPPAAAASTHLSAAQVHVDERSALPQRSISRRPSPLSKNRSLNDRVNQVWNRRRPRALRQSSPRRHRGRQFAAATAESERVAAEAVAARRLAVAKGHAVRQTIQTSRLPSGIGFALSGSSCSSVSDRPSEMRARQVGDGGCLVGRGITLRGSSGGVVLLRAEGTHDVTDAHIRHSAPGPQRAVLKSKERCRSAWSSGLPPLGRRVGLAG